MSTKGIAAIQSAREAYERLVERHKKEETEARWKWNDAVMKLVSVANTTIKITTAFNLAPSVGSARKYACEKLATGHYSTVEDLRILTKLGEIPDGLKSAALNGWGVLSSTQLEKAKTRQEVLEVLYTCPLDYWNEDIFNFKTAYKKFLGLCKTEEECLLPEETGNSQLREYCRRQQSMVEDRCRELSV